MSDSNLESVDIQPQSVLLTEGSFIADETISEDVNIDQFSQQTAAVPVDELSQAKLTERTQEAVEETLSDKLDKISVHDDEEEPNYVTPVADPYARAIKYMEHHNVMQIFQKLTAEIIYHRPDDPLIHMLGELQKMKKEREISAPSTAPE